MAAYDYAPQETVPSTYFSVVRPRNVNIVTYDDVCYFISSSPSRQKAVEPIGGVYAFPNKVHVESPEVLAITSVEDIVQAAKDVFGLNAVQIAELVGVSRPSLYNHITNKENPKSMTEYIALWDMATAVKRSTNIDIKPGLKSILVNGKTLLSHLRDKNNNAEYIVNVCQQIAEKLAVADLRSSSSTEQRQIVHANSILG